MLFHSACPRLKSPLQGLIFKGLPTETGPFVRPPAVLALEILPLSGKYRDLVTSQNSSLANINKVPTKPWRIPHYLFTGYLSSNCQAFQV